MKHISGNWHLRRKEKAVSLARFTDFCFLPESVAYRSFQLLWNGRWGIKKEELCPQQVNQLKVN